jgi:hypothetical protein
MVYVHPALGALTVVLVLLLGMQGLRSTHRAAYAADARRAHRRLSWWVFGLGVVVLGLGFGSTAWLRDDLAVAQTSHVLAAVPFVLLMAINAALSRRFAGSPRARVAHKWLGLVLMVAAVAVVALGMRLLP